MTVESIFLDPVSIRETNGQYGIVSASMPVAGTNAATRFSEQYINRNQLLEELQNQLALAGQRLCDLPADASRDGATAEYLTLKDIVEQVKQL